MQSKPLHIVANFNIRHKAARDMITGIMRFAASNPNWELQLWGNHPANDGFSTSADTEIDGIISGYDLNREDEPGQENIKHILRHGRALKAITVISVPLPLLHRVPCTRIDVDHHEIARYAARLFISHGFRHFAYVGAPTMDHWSLERGHWFEQEIKKQDYSVSHFPQSDKQALSPSENIARLRQWLKDLPKPCGVFAAYDQRAKHVIDICRQIGINIPKEIQVLGVDNESSICELTIPSLSSIAPDFEAAGFAAARELDRLMHGGRLRSRTLTIKTTAVIERLSTSDLTRSGDRVNRALEYFRTHYSERIGVTHAAHAVGSSSRLLEKDFKSVLGKSLCLVLQDIRLQQVAQSLRTTSTPLSTIARASGFSSETYLKNLFKRRYGMTMSEFRNCETPLNPLTKTTLPT